MNKEKIDDVYDLIDITIRDLYDITIKIGPERKTIDINCYFFGERKIIKLPMTEIKLHWDSAKDFIDYLKEKMTEGLGLKEKSDE